MRPIRWKFWSVFLSGILAGAIVSSCASVSFPYQFFGLDLTGQKLLGPAAAQDQPLSVCQATAEDVSPCSVVMTAVYEQLKQDYENKEIELQKCQAGQ